MVNVLSEEKKQQVVALGRLGWSLRRIQEATGVRRETCSGYLKAAGIELRAARRRRSPPSALDSDSKPASEVITEASFSQVGGRMWNLKQPLFGYFTAPPPPM